MSEGSDSLVTAYKAVEQAIDLVGAIQAPVLLPRSVLPRSDRFEDRIVRETFDCVVQLGRSLCIAIGAMKSPEVLAAARRATCESERPQWDGMSEASWLELGRVIAFRTYAQFGGLEVITNPDDPYRWPAVEAHLTESHLKVVNKWVLGTSPVHAGHLFAELRREFERAKASLNPPGPVSTSWSFRAGGYSFRGKTVALGGKRLGLLQYLSQSVFGRTILDIRDAIWGADSDVDDSTIRSTISELRTHLRKTFSLGGKDPILSVDRGDRCAYRLAEEVFESNPAD